MKLEHLITVVPVPKGSLNDKSTHFLARDGFVLERQKNGDVTVTKNGKFLGFVGAANVAYGAPLEEKQTEAPDAWATAYPGRIRATNPRE